MTFVVHVHVFLLDIDLLMDPWAHGRVRIQFQYQMLSFYSSWETVESVALPSTLEIDCMHNFIDCLNLFFRLNHSNLLEYLFGKEDMALKLICTREEKA